MLCVWVFCPPSSRFQGADSSTRASGCLEKCRAPVGAQRYRDRAKSAITAGAAHRTNHIEMPPSARPRRKPCRTRCRGHRRKRANAVATIGAAVSKGNRVAPVLDWRWGMMERTAGIEPAFSTPITVHRFVAGVGYVRVLARQRGFQPRSSFLRGKCPGALDDRRANWLPDQDSNLD